MTNDHPVLANPVLIASPSPRDAPVTIATLMACRPSRTKDSLYRQYNKKILVLLPEGERGPEEGAIGAAQGPR
jgi:hypothetical protein